MGSPNTHLSVSVRLFCVGKRFKDVLSGYVHEVSYNREHTLAHIYQIMYIAVRLAGWPPGGI